MGSPCENREEPTGDSMPMVPRPRPTRLPLSLLVALYLVASAAVAAKPRRNKPKPTPTPTPAAQQQPEPPREQAPPPGLAAVDERLWRYQTAAAREAIGPLTGQAESNPHVAMALGRVLEQEKRYGEAEARLRQAVALAPADPAPLVYLGEALLRQRRQGDANAVFRQAVEAARARGGSTAAYYLGVAQQRLQQYDQAVATLSGASGPEPALVPYQIGVTRVFQGNWGAAVEQLDRALAADSGLAYAYYYRALAQDKLGRKDRLVADMERFLALAPEAPEAEQARAILRAVKR
jgi:tetratricopeptide (TPR) repeat protein